MINNTLKTNCCGCGACVQICPASCISMVEDDEGFFYPRINEAACVGCGICDSVCPYLNHFDDNTPECVYAAINTDETIRQGSSSGGAFSAIAEKVLQENGVVFGASFSSDWVVRHVCVQDTETLANLRGSKYIQSEINNTFKDVRSFLNQGRLVLFSGTPCQIKGLLLFLQKKYDNLITIEVVCHGVPSPKVWKSFLKEINPDCKEITSVEFRNKDRGWSSYSVAIKAGNEVLFSDYARNCLFINSFIRNYSIRPSCFNCPARSGSSMADITLADFWGIEKRVTYLSDNKGVSAILVHSDKGELYVKNSGLEMYQVKFDQFKEKNKSYDENPVLNDNRSLFWSLFPTQGLRAVETIRIMSRKPFYKRVVNRIKRVFQG